MTDISGFMNWFLDLVLQGLGFVYSTLDGITFSGISLFDLIIALFTLGVALPLILTLLQSRTVEARSNYRRERRSSERRSDEGD